MKRLALTTILLLVAMTVTTSTAAPAPPPAAQLINQLRSRVADLRSDKADLKDQIKEQDAEISDLQDQNQRLRARINSQPDPLDAILARDPDGQWAAIIAIWRGFPARPAGLLCGYDKSNVLGDGVGLTLTSYTFYFWRGC